MLVTHCPECSTVFRVTEDILDQAEGQVRCGRCAQIFNGIDELRETPDAPTQTLEPLLEPLIEAADPEAAAPEYDGGPTNWFLTDPPGLEETETTAETEVEVEADAEAEAEPEPEPEAEAEAEADAEAETDTTAEAEPESESESETESETETESELALELVADEDEWPPALADERPRRSWPWTVAASLLILMLLGQGVHAWRSELAVMQGIGEPLSTLYARLGLELTPAVDLAQYELLNLAFASEAGVDSQNWLIIEARLTNNGPKDQAFPQVFVALTDRWGEVVAGRYFEPAEYSTTSFRDYSRMAIGRAIDAQFIVVDPGPEVTGYEVQLCTRIGQAYLCDGDEVFN